MGLMLLLVVLFAANVCGSDFSMLGNLDSPDAGKLLRLLTAQTHRVSVFDATDKAVSNALMHKGAISAFSEEAAIKFAAPVIVVLGGVTQAERLMRAAASAGKVFVLWDSPAEDEEVKRLEDAASIGGSHVCWAAMSPNNQGPVLGGKSEVLAIPAVRRFKTALENADILVEDDGTLHRKAVPCPAQQPGASLWTRIVPPHELNCVKTDLRVCRVYAKLAAPNHRLHVIALYDVEDDVSTNDPDGFFNTFKGSVVPLDKEIIDMTPNGGCDSYITMGISEGHTCASPDPTFDRTAFAEHGRIAKGSGWYCGSPTGRDTVPATAPKPPNTHDSILVAQLTVRPGFTVSGKLMIISADPAKKTTKVVQAFNCDCDTAPAEQP